MLTRLRHKVREFFWAVRLRDLWILSGRQRQLEAYCDQLEARCDRLERAVLEINPGLNWNLDDEPEPDWTAADAASMHN